MVRYAITAGRAPLFRGKGGGPLPMEGMNLPTDGYPSPWDVYAPFTKGGSPFADGRVPGFRRTGTPLADGLVPPFRGTAAPFHRKVGAEILLYARKMTHRRPRRHRPGVVSELEQLHWDALFRYSEPGLHCPLALLLPTVLQDGYADA